jgi:hypothetical protein
VLHAEGFGAVRVEQLQRADFVFADHAGDASQREFELLRLRRGWQKQAALHLTGLGRDRGEMHFQNGGARGMSLEIKLQKLEEHFGVEHGNGKIESASEWGGVSGCGLHRERIGWLPRWRSGPRLRLVQAPEGVRPHLVRSEGVRACVVMDGRTQRGKIFVQDGFFGWYVFQKMKSAVEFQLQA